MHHGKAKSKSAGRSNQESKTLQGGRKMKWLKSSEKSAGREDRNRNYVSPNKNKRSPYRRSGHLRIPTGIFTTTYIHFLGARYCAKLRYVSSVTAICRINSKYPKSSWADMNHRTTTWGSMTDRICNCESVKFNCPLSEKKNYANGKDTVLTDT